MTILFKYLLIFLNFSLSEELMINHFCYKTGWFLSVGNANMKLSCRTERFCLCVLSNHWFCFSTLMTDERVPDSLSKSYHVSTQDWEVFNINRRIGSTKYMTRDFPIVRAIFMCQTFIIKILIRLNHEQWHQDLNLLSVVKFISMIACFTISFWSYLLLLQ